MHPCGQRFLVPPIHRVHSANSWVQTFPGVQTPHASTSTPVSQTDENGLRGSLRQMPALPRGPQGLPTTTGISSSAPKDPASFLRDDDSNLENVYDTAREERREVLGDFCVLRTSRSPWVRLYLVYYIALYSIWPTPLALLPIRCSALAKRK